MPLRELALERGAEPLATDGDMVATPPFRQRGGLPNGDDPDLVAAIAVQQPICLGFADRALTATGLAPEPPG